MSPALSFAWVDAPLPWVLGPMAFCLAGSATGLKLAIPNGFRAAAIAIIGVMVGVRVGPETLTHVIRWWPTLLAAALYVSVAGALSTLYIYRVARLDFATAFFGGMPGGIVEMTYAAEVNGGDVQTVTLLHTVRLMAFVSILPLLAASVSGGDMGASLPPVTSISATTVTSWLWLVGAAGIGSLAAHRLHWPAPHFLGPLALTGLLQIAGPGRIDPPFELLAAAQIVIGITLGCRLSGRSLRQFATDLRIAAPATLLPIALTAAAAVVFQNVSGTGFLTMFLAFSAGGLVESTLVALTLNLDAAFITVHHLVRIVSVAAFAIPLFKRIAPTLGPTNPPAP